MPKIKQKTGNRPSAAAISDPRFANFETDPRFQLPSTSKTKFKIDKRFSRMLKDDDFTSSAKVDRYGRKVKTDTKKKALRRLYEVEDEDEDTSDDEGGARVDNDKDVQRELKAANAKYDPARGGGFSSSESDSDSDVSDDEDTAPAMETGPGLNRFRDAADVETGSITTRVAIVNIDWDHINSTDLFALFSSFAPIGGRVLNVSVYKSEFGKERMRREEFEGPAREIFKKKDEEEVDLSDSEDGQEDNDDVDSDEETKKKIIQEGDDQEFDHDALRNYQLDRLRYYFAVMTCSDTATSQKIYESVDGSEYLSSSNFLDLRFVPDDMTFDKEDIRDQCEQVPSGYKPVEFVTSALQSSKVVLTWDMHPDEVTRKESIKKSFTGSRSDIAENDLRAFLASDSEGESEAEDEPLTTGQAEEEPQLSKKDLARKKMREALGLADEPAAKAAKSGPVGDMEITFSSALMSKAGGKKDEDADETTIEKYKRKERERKSKRKEKAVAKREGHDPDAEDKSTLQEPAEDLGFDDPFFTSEDPVKASKSSVRKEERLKKRALREAEEVKSSAEKAQLELLMTDNTNEDNARLDHFDMNEIVRAEKKKSKKHKKQRAGKEERGGLQEDFEMDVADSRFKAVYDDHEFAIDPSNPKFKATDGMKKILEEGRRKRKNTQENFGTEKNHKKIKTAKANNGDVSSLIDSLKKKSGKAKR